MQGKLLRQNTTAYLFMLPWLVGLFLFTLWPMISSLYLSFTRFELLQPSEWIGMQNFKEIFTGDERFWQSLKVTFHFVVLSVPLKLLAALLVAMMLNRNIRGIGLYRSLYYLPSLIGGSVAVSIMWRQIFGETGVVNVLLSMFGLQGPIWISNPDYAIYTLIALATWQFGSSMVIFLAGLKQIPEHLYEASAIDGAGKVQQFFRITLPMLSPVMFFNLVMQVIGGFMVFTQGFIVTKGGPMDATLFYAIYLYEKGFKYFQMGYASALAWILLVIIGIFTAILFKTSKKWVHYESGGDK
ncbi:MAG: binding-protein-dependent transport system inner rane component [Paenibacillus sp.]|jgi:multiple sugar transport system permease protein|uniref:carbohydrate ABC transporter permease n=1 Tax=Paenibacillus sp. GCM10012303 TaxID=3317340 RepID=UPI0029F0D8F8|nr:binding-protein-dependent transport system inner rane component [Paenibacillus sp.]